MLTGALTLTLPGYQTASSSAILAQLFGRQPLVFELSKEQLNDKEQKRLGLSYYQ